MTDTAPTTRRRWFRFSLGTLLLLLTLVAVAAFGIRERIHREQLQTRITMLEAEMATSQDASLRRVAAMLKDLDVAISNCETQRVVVGSTNDLVLQRLIKMRNLAEAKFTERQEQLLKAVRQQNP